MDVLGTAIAHYHKTGIDAPVSIWINGRREADLLPSVFFRNWPSMKGLERYALLNCYGEILDVGAAAGCHSLFLQKKKLSVTSLDVSAHCCDVMKSRGLQQVVCTDIMNYKEKKFDTILLLMNGFGIAANQVGLLKFLRHLRKLLNPGGHILGESTNISYLYEQAGISPLDLANGYGCVEFRASFKRKQASFQWLYPDEALLRKTAAEAGLLFEVIDHGKHDDFLVRLSH
jgi:SAM-dependent methyltransferase